MMEDDAEPPLQVAEATSINHKLDKENLRFPEAPNRQTPQSQHLQRQQQRSDHLEKPRSPFPSWIPLSTSVTARVASTTTPSSTPSKQSSITMTPQASSSSPQQHFYSRLTPPGTSKLLRDHFCKLSLLAPAPAANTPPSVSSYGSNGTQRKRRLMDSGPVRLLAPNTTPTASPPPLPMSPSSPCRRIGFDGTHLTPSRELLKSTVSSRNQRAVAPVTSNENHDESTSPKSGTTMMASANMAPPRSSASEEDSSSTDRTINSSDHNGPGFHTSTTSSWNHSPYHHNDAAVSIPVVLTAKLQSVNNLNYKMSRRVDCGDPVAWTLWKGGEEDFPWLLEQDRRVVPKVSSNLSDIYGDTTTAELARPIPVLATRRPC